jgi:hypothetical protein
MSLRRLQSIFGLVVDDDFHFFGEVEEFILGVDKIVLDDEGFQDGVEGLFFEIDAQFGKGSFSFVKAWYSSIVSSVKSSALRS